MQTSTLAPLAQDSLYSLLPEAGLVEAPDAQTRGALAGSDWEALQDALDDPAPFSTTLPLTAEMMPALRPQLRALLHYHCGVEVLRTRQLMLDIQAL